MTFLCLAMILALLPESLQAMAEFSNHVAKTSDADARLAQWAEEASARVASIHADNRNLQQLRATCLAGAINVPPAHAAIAAAGAEALARQSVLEIELQALSLRMRLSGDVEQATSFREPSGPCELPGILRLTPVGQVILNYREPRAGFCLESADAYSQPSWHYAHDRVQPL